MKVTQALNAFLKSQKNAIQIYRPELETQVNIRRDLGVRQVYTSDSGKKWIGFSDDKFTWKPFRIPWKARDKPEYIDYDMKWPLDKYAEGIGCTGWDFINKRSLWVGFDFDSITTHTKGLPDTDIQKIIKQVQDIPWVTVYSSKSGKGIHLYIFIKNSPIVNNHTEHAALARSILSLLSGFLSIKFEDKVDCIGQILWIWHKDAKSNGLKLIKKGEFLVRPPGNWKEHIDTVKQGRKKRYIPPKFIDRPKDFDNLDFRSTRSSLDATHQSLLSWLATTDKTWWWDSDFNMLVCHTHDLASAHTALKLRGIFYTRASGKDVPNDQNCFCYPLPSGGWVVRRHHKETKEHKYWFKDPTGWTTCYFNIDPDFDTACRLKGGVKSSSGQYVFVCGWDALKAAELLGFNPDLDVSDEFLNRTGYLKQLKGNELSLRIERQDGDPISLADWCSIRSPRAWELVGTYNNTKIELETPDSFLRHVIQGTQEAGWYLFTSTLWIKESKTNIISALAARGIQRNDTEVLLGQAIYNPWILVKIPFEREYPGGKQWNVGAPQLSVEPTFGDHLTWDKLLGHIGKNLDEAIQDNDWCIKYSITTGADYLLLWIASMIRYPREPLPYLFLYGPQDSGKSTLHEALSLLFKEQIGYIQADTAITSQQGFCGELMGAVLCVIEEINVAKVKRAYDRIKDWTTGKTLTIHPKGKDPFVVPNFTHWIQCANTSTYCPVLPGDTRINIIPVDKPENIIPKIKFLADIKNEISSFLYTLMSLEIPDPDSRLRIPCLSSKIKEELQEYHRSPIEVFLIEECIYTPGTIIRFSDFVEEFLNWLPPADRRSWNTRNISRLLPPQYPRAKYGKSGTFYLGNIKLTDIHTITVELLSTQHLNRVDGRFVI